MAPGPIEPRVTRDIIPAFFVGLCMAVVLTWPLTARFTSSGRFDSGDGRFSIWNIAWVANAVTTNPGGLLDANIFYPATRTLAYSEPNLVAGVLAAPVWLATKNPYAAANSALLLSFALAFTTTFLLVRHLTGRRFPALAAAMFFAFNSYVFAHLPHIQLLMTFGLPLSLLALHRFVDVPSASRALALGAAVAVQALACGYYGLFAFLTVGVGLVWFGLTQGHALRRRYWALALLAGVVAVLLLSPLISAFLTVREAGFSRSLDEAKIFRAGWRSYFASALIAYRWLLPWLGHWRELLFPGFLSLAFAGITLVHVARGREGGDPRAPVVLFYVTLAMLAAWASFGPDGGLYRWLYDAVPFMSFVRAPARFGVLVILVTAVLAGLGVAVADGLWTGRRRAWVRAAILLAVAARSTVGPLDLTDGPAPSRAALWLRTLPKGGTAEFPFNGPGGQRFDQTVYMVGSAWHWQPLVNGYSDFTPPDLESLLPALETFPSAAALAALGERRARYIVVNWDLYPVAHREEIRRRIQSLAPRLRPMLNDPRASLYELLPDATRRTGN